MAQLTLIHHRAVVELLPALALVGEPAGAHSLDVRAISLSWLRWTIEIDLTAPQPTHKT